MKNVKRYSLYSVVIIIFALFLPHNMEAASTTPTKIEGAKSVENRILVPMRAIFEELDATVQWDQATNRITAVRGKDTVQLTVNSRHASVNGSHVLIDVPAQAEKGRTYVPIRFVSEALGAQVNWDSKNRIVHIYASDRYIQVLFASPNCGSFLNLLANHNYSNELGFMNSKEEIKRKHGQPLRVVNNKYNTTYQYARMDEFIYKDFSYEFGHVYNAAAIYAEFGDRVRCYTVEQITNTLGIIPNLRATQDQKGFYWTYNLGSHWTLDVYVDNSSNVTRMELIYMLWH